MCLISRREKLFNKIIASNNPINCKSYFSKIQKINFIINQYILIHLKLYLMSRHHQHVYTLHLGNKHDFTIFM